MACTSGDRLSRAHGERSERPTYYSVSLGMDGVGPTRDKPLPDKIVAALVGARNYSRHSARQVFVQCDGRGVPSLVSHQL